MFDVLRESPRRTIFIFGLVALVGVVYLLAIISQEKEANGGRIGAPLDDTWIHVRFASHIAEGQGLSYNDGVLTTGATSPLWVLSLASVFAVTTPTPFQQVNIAILMSAIGFILAAWSITGLGWWASRKAWVGLGAGLVTVLTGRFVWMGLSGMEITTFAAFCILALWSHSFDVRAGHSFGWRTGILCALATLARPEGYLLTALIGFDAFIIQSWRDIYRESSIQWLAVKNHILAGWRGVMAYGTLAGSYPLAALLISGYPLPNTFRAKSKLGSEFPDLPHAYFWAPNNEHGPLLIILAAIGLLTLLWLARKSRNPHQAWAVWPVVFVLGVLFGGSQHFVIVNSRYVAPSIPFHALLAMVGISTLADLSMPRLAIFQTKPRLKTVIPSTLAILLAFLVFFRGYENAQGVVGDAGNIYRMHVEVAEWLKGRSEPDTLIALNDVGAIVHLSNLPVLDLEGLVSEEVLDATKDEDHFTCGYDLQLARLMQKDRPRWIAVFPWFYPCLTSWPGALQAETVFTITGPTVIAGGEMVVYYPIWENWPVLNAIPADVTTVDAQFEEGITLAAYTSQVIDGQLQVTFWWKNNAPHTIDYHVFVHLIDDNDEFIGQDDGQPQDDRFPFSLWKQGDIIRDSYTIPLETTDSLNLEGVQLRIGIYEFDTNRRLRVMDDATEFILLPPLTSES